MRRKDIREKRTIKGIVPIQSYEGEMLETKVKRLEENKEPIKDAAPTTYTNKKDGVLPQYNIQIDKWDLVLEKMEAENQQKQKIARGMQPQKSTEESNLDEGGTEKKTVPST